MKEVKGFMSVKLSCSPNSKGGHNRVPRAIHI